MSNGIFITFEGGEGAGKTTQIKRLAEYLSHQGHEVITTREPGGTPDAEKIRDLLVQKDGGEWTHKTETLLFFAARHTHVETKIKPALEAGKIVICDRFTDSTRAYQAYGHGLDLDFVEDINRLTLQNFVPDITFVLDIAAQEGLKRSRAHLSETTDSRESGEHKFEALDLEFHSRLQQGFLDIAKRDPERCHVIDASQEIDDIQAQIQKTVETYV